MYLKLQSHHTRLKEKVDIPTDILLKIIEYLLKSDWLSLRPVSRDFYEFSANLKIFKELLLHPVVKDIEIFRHICNHRFLGKHVTTITVPDTKAFSQPLWIFLVIHELITPKGLRFAKDCGQVIFSNALKQLPALSSILISRGWQLPIEGSRYGCLSLECRHRRMCHKRHLISSNPPEEQLPQLRLDVLVKLLLATGIRLSGDHEWPDRCKFDATPSFEIPCPLFTKGQVNFLTSISIRFPYTEHGDLSNSPMVKIIHGAKKLEKLHLHMMSGKSCWTRISGPEDCLGSNKEDDLPGIDHLAAIFCKGITFSHLKELRLQGLHTSDKTIFAVTGTHGKTLKSLKLMNLRFPKEGPELMCRSFFSYFWDIKTLRVRNINDGEDLYHTCHWEHFIWEE